MREKVFNVINSCLAPVFVFLSVTIDAREIAIFSIHVGGQVNYDETITVHVVLLCRTTCNRMFRTSFPVTNLDTSVIIPDRDF